MTPSERPGSGSARDHADKLGRVRPVSHDDEERPSAEDRDFGQTIFTRKAVPLPRVLRGRRKGKAR